MRDIVADVLAMVTAAQVDRMFGPYILYVPANFWVKLQDDYKANSDKTILQRVREISGIEDVKPVDKLADSNVLLVQLTKSNVDMVIGMQPTTVQWETQGGMMMMFKVMSIMVPRIKLDHNNAQELYTVRNLYNSLYLNCTEVVMMATYRLETETSKLFIGGKKVEAWRRV